MLAVADPQAGQSSRKLDADDVLERLHNDPQASRFVQFAPDPLAGAGGGHELRRHCASHAVRHVAVRIHAIELVAGVVPDRDGKGDRRGVAGVPWRAPLGRRRIVLDSCRRGTEPVVGRRVGRAVSGRPGGPGAGDLEQVDGWNVGCPVSGAVLGGHAGGNPVLAGGGAGDAFEHLAVRAGAGRERRAGGWDEGGLRHGSLCLVRSA